MGDEALGEEILCPSESPLGIVDGRLSTILLRTMWIMNFPDIIYGMTDGGPVNSTTILAIQMINKVFQEYDYGQASAVGVIIMGILFVYAFFYLNVSSRWEVQL